MAGRTKPVKPGCPSDAVGMVTGRGPQSVMADDTCDHIAYKKIISEGFGLHGHLVSLM
jgi:hypothetical protein